MNNRDALYLDLLHDLGHWIPSSFIPFRDTSWSLGPEASVKQYAARNLVKTFLKKNIDAVSSTADNVALNTFLSSNSRCSEWKMPESMSLKEELMLGIFEDTLYRFFNKPSRVFVKTGDTCKSVPVDHHILSHLSDILHSGSTGPGASIDVNGTDFYTKMFSSRMSQTRSFMYSYMESGTESYPHFSRGLSDRFEEFGKPSVVAGNRLCFVPKSVDTSRVICVEPLLNMYYQQGIRALMERRLSQVFGIDLADQQYYNRELARIGSLNESVSTIDLSSASDSISRGMLEKFLPQNTLRVLEKFRSTTTSLPDGREIDLHMISSMGNAFTFPLETILFACAVSSVYDVMGKTMRCRDTSVRIKEDVTSSLEGSRVNAGVFGDDIIVEQECYDNVVRLLELLGFLPNEEKSFKQGPFRESCGGDFYKSSPVRGVYIKTLKTPASRYVAINRLNDWSGIQGILLPRTIRRLVKSVRFLPVPMCENDDAGIKMPMTQMSNLQYDANGSVLYKRWTTKPKQMRLSEGDIKVPKGAKPRFVTNHGMLSTYLRGDMNNGRISIRLGAQSYYTKQAVTHNWDYMPSERPNEGRLPWKRYSTSITLNFLLG